MSGFFSKGIGTQHKHNTYYSLPRFEIPSPLFYKKEGKQSLKFKIIKMVTYIYIRILYFQLRGKKWQKSYILIQSTVYLDRKVTYVFNYTT